MASPSAFLANFEEQRVSIAVDESLDHELAIATGIALTPQFSATTTPVHHSFFSHSHRQTLAIHPSHHQHLTSVNVLSDSWHQAISIEFD
jgi:hypothetical protein